MSEMPAGYDAWKTREPDYWREDPEEPGCPHDYWHTHYAFITGKATCGQCGERLPWRAPLPFAGRLTEAWHDLRWWMRWTAMPGIKRPWRALRSWRRGHRTAPWKCDDEIPF